MHGFACRDARVGISCICELHASWACDCPLGTWSLDLEVVVCRFVAPADHLGH